MKENHTHQETSRRRWPTLPGGPPHPVTTVVVGRATLRIQLFTWCSRCVEVEAEPLLFSVDYVSIFWIFTFQAPDGLGPVPIKSVEIQVKHSHSFLKLQVRPATWYFNQVSYRLNEILLNLNCIILLVCSITDYAVYHTVYVFVLWFNGICEV